MNIFNSLSYRKILKAKIESVKKTKPGLGILRISEKAGLHGSFVSVVLKEQKHLSADQLFEIGDVLGFSYKELDYLLLLLNLERSVDKRLIEKLKSEIEEIQKEHSKTSTHISTKPQESLDLDLAEYYADPFYKIIHVFLGVEEIGNNPALLSEHLNLSPQKIQNYLMRLNEMGIISLEGAEVKVLKKNYHLPKDFFICKPHQSAMKALSQQSLNLIEDSKKETVCVTFSGEEETYKAVHAEFLDFLKKTENHVKKSHPKEVFQLNFDLHYWSKS